MTNKLFFFLTFCCSYVMLTAQDNIVYEQLPGASPISSVMTTKILDPQVLNAPDGNYYLTGVCPGDSHNVPLYRSSDLKTWRFVKNVLHSTSYFQAPEIHYINNIYWIVVSHCEQIQLYKSDDAIGPYILHSSLLNGRSPSLFEDKDSSNYLIFGDGQIVPLTKDLKSVIGRPHRIIPSNYKKPSYPGWVTEMKVTDRVGTDGAFMRYENGKYFLYCNDWGTRLNTRLNETYYAVADSITGPYSLRKLSLLHSGQGSIFKDKAGKAYAVFSPLQSDDKVCINEKPVIEELKQNQESGFVPSGKHSFLKEPWASLQPNHPANMRDPSIHLGPDNYYYLVYTEGGGEARVPEATIKLWRSKDLQNWTEVARLLNWNEVGGQVNGNPIKLPDLLKVWAPEITYIKSKKLWLLTFSMPLSGENGGSQSWILKSEKVEGPYKNITKGAMVNGIDGFIFEDENGSVYYLWQNGNIAKMNDNLTGFAEKPSFMNGFTGVEGMSLIKINGKYMLTKSVNIGEVNVCTYDAYYGVADNVYGPYTLKGCIEHGGHSTWFKGVDDKWRMTIFGSDVSCPIHQRLGIFRFDVDENFTVIPKINTTK